MRHMDMQAVSRETAKIGECGETHMCIHRRKSLRLNVRQIEFVRTLCFSFTYCSVRLLAVLSSALSLSFSSLPGGRIRLPSFLGDGTCQIEFVH